MRAKSLMVTAVLLCGAAAASAAPANSTARYLRPAQADLTRGQEQLARSDAEDGNAARLRALERARFYLRRARLAAARGIGGGFVAVGQSIERALVRTLVDEAEIYYLRRSLTLAQKRVVEALTLDPDNSAAQQLAASIQAAGARDIFDGNVGAIFVQRLRERRAEMGIPIRDRGFALRH